MGRIAGLAVAILLIAGCAAASAPGQLGDSANGLWQRLPVTGGKVESAVGDGATEPAARLRAHSSAAGHRGPRIATVLRPTRLHYRGQSRRIGTRTRFDGPQMLAVVGKRPGWVAVLHDLLPNGRAGWVRAGDVRITTTPWRMRVDRSDRVAVLLRGRRVVERFTVGIGQPGSETPTGRFAITDRMVTRGAAQTYGCCILALSGRQPYLPAGWPGGDRLALHGSPGDGDVGRAASAGCLTAKAAVLQRLLKRLPVGTRVDIRA